MPNIISYVLWDDCALLVVNPNKAVTDFLTMIVKSIEMPKGKDGLPRRGPKKIFRKKVPAYTVIQDSPGLKVIQTQQGFVEDVCRLLREDPTREFSFFDKRKEFPKPALELMKGFRFSQKALTTQFLLRNQSGLLGAPTRYGKSTCMVNILRAYPTLRILVVIPGKDLLKQTYRKIKEEIPYRDVVMLGGGSSKKYQSEKGITVVSADSLHRVCPSEIDLIVADEVHSLVTTTRMDKWEAFCDIRKYGVGATLQGRFDGRDKLITGLFGPVLAERTYTEAVAEGAICPLVIFFLKIDMPMGKPITNRDAAYDRVFFKNPAMASLVGKICREVIPATQQALVFIDNEVQAELYLKHLGYSEGVIAMAKRLTDKQRDAMFELMQTGEIMRCFATNIYAQGVTFSDMRAMINAEAGGNNTSAIQKPGRLAEIIPGKKWGTVIDFLFQTPPELDREEHKDSALWHLYRDSQARLKAYSDKGYKVVIVDSLEDLKREFDNHQ